MPARHLPAAPSLEHLRKQAKELLHGVRAGDPTAVELARELHPRVADGTAEPATLTLAGAQLVVARQHGFPSWLRLREYWTCSPASPARRTGSRSVGRSPARGAGRRVPAVGEVAAARFGSRWLDRWPF